MGQFFTPEGEVVMSVEEYVHALKATLKKRPKSEFLRTYHTWEKRCPDPWKDSFLKVFLASTKSTRTPFGQSVTCVDEMLIAFEKVIEPIPIPKGKGAKKQFEERLKVIRQAWIKACPPGWEDEFADRTNLIIRFRVGKFGKGGRAK